MAIRRLIGWIFQSSKWFLALAGGITIGLVGLFFADAFLPYFGQSSHGNQVEARIAAVLKTDQREFPVAKVADFEWSHVCYAARGVMPSKESAKKLGMNVSGGEIQRPWFGDRRFWTLVFVLPHEKIEVVRLSRSKAGGHRGYGSSESYCLLRDEAVFDVAPDATFGKQLTLVKREWRNEEKLNQLIVSSPDNTLLSADHIFQSDWKTMCIVPSGHKQFEVSHAVGAQVEWHSVLYPWIESAAYYSLILLDKNAESRVIRIPANQYIPSVPSSETTIPCRARSVAKILIRTGPGDIKALYIPN